MDSLIFEREEMEYWDAYDEYREKLDINCSEEKRFQKGSTIFVSMSLFVI